ncbi:unnamed protein product [Rotaria sp. Silwood1]|nr:unnamed protein product [Rotaria sp. Silwood1]
MAEEKICVKCKKIESAAKCYGCQQSYCIPHFLKHRLYLAQKMDALQDEHENLQKEVDENNYEQSFLSSIDTWERRAIRKIHDIAEKARNDIQEFMEKRKDQIKISLNNLCSNFNTTGKSDNYTEIEIDKWTKQLSELRHSLENPTNISIVEDRKTSSTIRGIKVIEQQEQEQLLCSNLLSQTNNQKSEVLIEPIQEHFVPMYGPCTLSEDKCLVKHSSYRAGLSQISGFNNYSSGKHSIVFLIENKGPKNIFIGIHSTSKEVSSSTYDRSIYGWWNLDYVIMNGDNVDGNNSKEIIQTGDKITLIIDCDNQQIQFEHHRIKKLVHLPVVISDCPFPWQILIRLVNSGPVLIRGLTEIVERRPNDPIEYLATFLYKQVQNTRAQKKKEEEAKQLELERQQAEEEKQHRAQLKNEIRALREQEENERKQREAEEKRKRDAEELARRHKELAAAPPPLPAVREEDDVFVVEFGETELHRQAAVQNANLSELLRDNYHSIASRNAEGKTPRDVALDAGLQENVDQIDTFCVQLLQNGNTKAINDLLLCGYTEIINQLKTIEDTDEDTNDFINNEIPQLLGKIKQLNQAIKDGDIETVDTMISDRKNFALYRDSEGSSSLHDAIENRQYNIALSLLQKYPSLALVKDIRDRASLDLLNSIDEDTITDEQRDAYDQLKEALISTSAGQQND